MDAKEIAELKEAGTLQEKSEGHYQISGITIDGKPVAPMALDVESGADPVAKLMPRSDLYMMTLGYEFLSQYKTLWDYRRSTLTLLQK